MKTLVILVLLSFSLIGCRSSILDDPSTQINYTLPQKAHVIITIENNYNTVIATLVDGPMEAGTHSAVYSPQGLLEGVYYYNLEAKGIGNDYYYKIKRQMVIVK